MTQPKRVNFYIDGWNVYCGLDAYREKNKPKKGCGYDFRWSDYYKLCKNVCRRKWGDDAVVGTVYFFTTDAPLNRHPNIIHSPKNHKDFIEVMKSCGVEVVLGRVDDNNKEKETDVNIAVQMVVDSLVRDTEEKEHCDVCVLLSADSDFAPALQKVSVESEGKVETMVMLPLGGTEWSARLQEVSECDKIKHNDFKGAALQTNISIKGKSIKKPRHCEGVENGFNAWEDG